MADDFEELPALKREAGERARKLGHLLTRWKQAAWSDLHWSAYCQKCSALAVINLDDDMPVDRLSGRPVQHRCEGGTGWREGS